MNNDEDKLLIGVCTSHVDMRLIYIQHLHPHAGLTLDIHGSRYYNYYYHYARVPRLIDT